MLTHLNSVATLPKRVVIIGAAGFVGGAIAQAARAQDVPTFLVTRRDVDLLADRAADKLAALLEPEDAVVAAARSRRSRLRACCETISRLRDDRRRAPAAAGRPSAQYRIGRRLWRFARAADRGIAGRARIAARRHASDARDHAGRGGGATPYASLRPTLIYGVDDPHNGYGPNSFRRLAAVGKGDRAVRRRRGAARPRRDRGRGAAGAAHPAPSQPRLSQRRQRTGWCHP